MRFNSPRIRSLVLALGLLTWILGLTAQQVHQLLVVHVTCPEHGEVVELSSDDEPAAHAEQSGPSWQLPDGDLDHDQVCGVPTLSLGGLASASVRSPLPQVVEFDHGLRPRQHLARGPPLAFAPKTSPPALILA